MFYLTHRQDLIRCYHSGSEKTWQWWPWRGTLYSPKLQHLWSLTLRLFIVITRTLVEGVLRLYGDAVGIFYSRLGPSLFVIFTAPRRISSIVITKSSGKITHAIIMLILRAGNLVVYLSKVWRPNWNISLLIS